jgi:hypothetical protein
LLLKPGLLKVGERGAWLMLPLILLVSTLLSSPLFYSAKLETVETILVSLYIIF